LELSFRWKFGRLGSQIEMDAVALSQGAATPFGVPTGKVYQHINSGEIADVLIGSRRYISRDQLTAFIDGHSHTGYTPSR
jgi:hypothetical protein